MVRTWTAIAARYSSNFIVLAALLPLTLACASAKPAASGAAPQDAAVGADAAGDSATTGKDTAVLSDSGIGDAASVSSDGLSDGAVADQIDDSGANTGKDGAVDVFDAGPEVNAAFSQSAAGCQAWWGTGCGNCKCEAQVCKDAPQCCKTLWGQACASACADFDPTCTPPDAEVVDAGPSADVPADTGPFTCNPQYSGTIPGAKFDFSKTPCQYSIAKAKGQFPLPYDLIVNESTMVHITDTNIGQCAPANVFGGLATFVHIDGIGDGNYFEWCMCDIGNCPPPKDITYAASTPGTFTHNFVWDGNVFNGPSDTGNKSGPAFPPGTYTMTVTSQGTFKHADGTEDGFYATAKLDILLTP